MRVIVLDTETSGLKPPVGVCECAFIELDPDTLRPIGQYHSLIDPEMPISASASGVHRITDDMVRDKPTLGEWFRIVLRDPFVNEDVLMIAHHAKFDHPLVAKYLGNSRTLCTLKLARHVYPDAENHKLATLKYLLGLGKGGHSHGAMTDVEDCLDLLYRCCDMTGYGLTELLTFQDEPRLITHMPFGKHKGLPLQEVPHGWIAWLMRQENVDPDLLHSLKHFKLI